MGRMLIFQSTEIGHAPRVHDGGPFISSCSAYSEVVDVGINALIEHMSITSSFLSNSLDSSGSVRTIQEEVTYLLANQSELRLCSTDGVTSRWE